jgi:transcription-repair coupling factor (superfamily II helicase)
LKANSRTPTSSATACKRSSRFRPLKIQVSKLNSACHQRHRAAAKNLSAGEIQKRTRSLARGDKIAPLDLIEWLEEQGYEPEAQVSQKGEIALRGGILDVWPLTSPWPVRLEFFGDELESLRFFDPLTQISRGEISRVTLPPAGELGILKNRSAEVRSQKSE